MADWFTISFSLRFCFHLTFDLWWEQMEMIKRVKMPRNNVLEKKIVNRKNVDEFIIEKILHFVHQKVLIIWAENWGQKWFFLLLLLYLDDQNTSALACIPFWLRYERPHSIHSDQFAKLIIYDIKIHRDRNDSPRRKPLCLSELKIPSIRFYYTKKCGCSKDHTHYVLLTHSVLI